MTMPTTSEELKTVNPVINGVDSPQLMSVDSTEPIEIEVDEEKLLDGDENASNKDKEKSEKPKETADVKETEEKDEEGDVEEDDSEESESKSTDSKSVQKRIGKLTKKMRTAERELEKERKEREKEVERRRELEEKLKTSETETLKGNKPKKTDFEDEDEYIEALIDWKTELKSKTSEVVKEGKKTSVDKVEPLPGLNEAIGKGEKKYSDFKELTTNEDLVFSPRLAEITLETENPEDIMYFLANHPEESKRLSLLSDVSAAREIGKLETKLLKPAKAKKQSKAPEPITPVNTDVSVDKSPDKMSPAEYRAWREKNK